MRQGANKKRKEIIFIRYNLFYNIYINPIYTLWEGRGICLNFSYRKIILLFFIKVKLPVSSSIILFIKKNMLKYICKKKKKCIYGKE